MLIFYIDFFLVKRRKIEQEQLQQALRGAGHVIIKRDPAQGDHLSDYGKMFIDFR